MVRSPQTSFSAACEEESNDKDAAGTPCQTSSTASSAFVRNNPSNATME
jgi:hypothetical protein